MGVNTCLKDIHTLYPVQYLLSYVCIQDFFVPIISICFLLGSFPSGQLVIHYCLWSLMWAHLCFSTKCMNRDSAPSLDFFSSFRNPHRALDASWGRGTGTTVVDTKGTIGYMLMQLTYALWSYLISVLEPTLHPTVDYCQIHWSHNLVGLIGPNSWWEVPTAWSLMSHGQASVLPGLRNMTGVVFKWCVILFSRWQCPASESQGAMWFSHKLRVASFPITDISDTRGA